MVKLIKREYSYSNDRTRHIDIEDKCCETPNINIRSGNKVCLNCGMVLGVELLQKERRAFTKDEYKERKRTQIRWR